MPRNNPLKSRSADELAMEYVINVNPSMGSPVAKMYSSADLWNELMKRCSNDYNKAAAYVDRAQDTVKLLGD